MLPLTLFHHLLVLLATFATASSTQDDAARQFFARNGTSSHTNNWAVLVCTSRYWFNYRVCCHLLGSWLELMEAHSTWPTP